MSQEWWTLDPIHTDPARLKRERQKARELRRSAWWQQQIGQGRCEYCGGNFKPQDLTMDHVVPLARGGASSRGNLRAACRQCNARKKLSTPVEQILNSQS